MALKVVFVSTTPVAAAPWENMKCLNKYCPDIQVRWIADEHTYADGRVFPKDLIWNQDREEAIRCFQAADLIHIHNDLNLEWEPWLRGKRVLGQLITCPNRQDAYARIQSVAQDYYTLQQPMQMREFNLPALPLLLDPEEYTPNPVKNDPPKIVFAPTNRFPITMTESKGANEVEAILKEFAGEARFDIVGKLTYEENLERKRAGDILVDDVVNHTFNKTSLEGCCFGLAVISSSPLGGWIRSDLKQLPLYVKMLLREKEFLRHMQAWSREWMETNWHPRNLVQTYVDAYEKLLKNKPGSQRATPARTSGWGEQLLAPLQSAMWSGLVQRVQERQLRKNRKKVAEQSIHDCLQQPSPLAIEYWIDEYMELGTNLKIKGWAFILNQDMAESGIHLFLRAEDERVFVLETEAMKRPDVSLHFNHAGLDDTGFVAFVDRKKLKPGRYTVGIAVVVNKQQAVVKTDKTILVE